MSGEGFGGAWVTRGLLLLCLALAYPVYLGVTEEPAVVANLGNAEPIGIEDGASGDTAWEPPLLDDLLETVERPLFSPDRRPAPRSDEGPTVEATSEAPIDLSVKGVVIAERSRSALLQIRQNQRMVRVAEGDKVGGWRIDAITPVGVRISRGDETSDLLLKDTPGQRPRGRRAAPAQKDPEEPRDDGSEPDEDQDEPD